MSFAEDILANIKDGDYVLLSQASIELFATSFKQYLMANPIQQIQRVDRIGDGIDLTFNIKGARQCLLLDIEDAHLFIIRIPSPKQEKLE